MSHVVRVSVLLRLYLYPKKKKKKQIILRPVHMFSVLISAHVFKMHEKLLIERRVKAQSLSVHIYVFKMHERFWTNVNQNSYTSNIV